MIYHYEMDRREFLIAGTATILSAPHVLQDAPRTFTHTLPVSDVHYKQVKSYVENTPVPEYHWASERAYEDFLDMKFGIRLHWGIYSVRGFLHESWPFLNLSNEERQAYNSLYKTWNPSGFNADEWVSFFAESGAKMFSFTSKHHEGFSMFDTRTRVRSRVNWTAPGGPAIEECDLAYSIMETPFKTDVVKELCDAAHKHRLKIDLYFSHPDWYDADFRPYAYHPLQTAASMTADTDNLRERIKSGNHFTVAPEPSSVELMRMMARHRAQLAELLSNYGKIDMIGLDQWLGPAVWPQLRETIMYLRTIQPDVMFRARGIGNYGDYYTPEGFVPGSKENTDVPWFVIYPLGRSFSYDPDAAQYKGSRWIVQNLVDIVAKGGNFMVGIGPDGNGEFHPEAYRQLRAVGRWLKINSEAIYATRAREGALWSEGETIRFTRTKDKRFVYAITTEWQGKTLMLGKVKPRSGSAVFMLGYPEPLEWTQGSDDRIRVAIPDNLQDASHRPCEFAWTFKIEAEGQRS